jgi:hypothetical protein
LSNHQLAELLRSVVGSRANSPAVAAKLESLIKTVAVCDPCDPCEPCDACPAKPCEPECCDDDCDDDGYVWIYVPKNYEVTLTPCHEEDCCD